MQEVEKHLIEYKTNFDKMTDINKAIEYSSDKLNEIYELIKTNMEEFKNYIHKRDSENTILENLAIKQIDNMRTQFKKLDFSCELLVMSSLGSRTNLLKESDLDIGVLVKNLDEDKLLKIANIMIENGFRYTHFIVSKSNYYSFEKIIDGVEVEYKVRDLELSKPIIELHEKLNNLDKKTQDMLTYLKYNLKQNENKFLYVIFKALMYNAYFKDIKDAFIITIQST